MENLLAEGIMHFWWLLTTYHFTTQDYVQFGLALVSGTSVYLINSHTPKQQFAGSCLGLASQPFWLYSTYTAHQWGMFILAGWYTYNWIRGIRKYHALLRTSVNQQ